MVILIVGYLVAQLRRKTTILYHVPTGLMDSSHNVVTDPARTSSEEFPISWKTGEFSCWGQIRHESCRLKYLILEETYLEQTGQAINIRYWERHFCILSCHLQP